MGSPYWMGAEAESKSPAAGRDGGEEEEEEEEGRSPENGGAGDDDDDEYDDPDEVAGEPDGEGGVLTPPINFASVDEGVYRCGYPRKRNFSFLTSLQLRSIVYLCPEAYPDPHMQFLSNQGIKLFHHGIQGTKGGSTNIPLYIIKEALRVILDKRNHPILIHCRKGKHRTGCLIGCLRKVQNFPLPSILDEYRYFTQGKARVTDQEFIEKFDVSNFVGSTRTKWICSCNCRCKQHLTRVHPTTYVSYSASSIINDDQ